MRARLGQEPIHGLVAVADGVAKLTFLEDTDVDDLVDELPDLIAVQVNQYGMDRDVAQVLLARGNFLVEGGRGLGFAFLARTSASWCRHRRHLALGRETLASG